MRLLLQRVKEGSVWIEGKLYSSINKGLLIFFGAKMGDNRENLPLLAQKVVNMRIFSDADDKMNLSINEVEGEILVVSQFTLYGDTTSRRPSFTGCAKPDDAKLLYEGFVLELKKLVKRVETGFFAAKMEVHLINDGPVTFMLDFDH